MDNKLHLKIYLSPTVDLNNLWRTLSLVSGTHLGGESGYYTVIFDGLVSDGLNVLSNCLSVCDGGKFYADFGT